MKRLKSLSLFLARGGLFVLVFFVCFCFFLPVIVTQWIDYSSFSEKGRAGNEHGPHPPLHGLPSCQPLLCACQVKLSALLQEEINGL